MWTSGPRDEDISGTGNPQKTVVRAGMLDRGQSFARNAGAEKRITPNQ